MHAQTDSSLNPSRAETPAGVLPTQILWIGDATLAQRFASRRAPHLHIKGCDAGAVAQHFLEQGGAPGSAIDVIVIDSTERDVDPVHIATLAEAHSLHLPIILLVAVGQEALADKLSRFAVCDCIVKTQEFIHQFLPAVTQVRARHDLSTAFGVSREREERVRHILETQPAVACIVEPGGRLVAVNRAGQALLGGAGEQLVGHNIAEFLPEEAQADVLPIFQLGAGEERHGFLHAIRRIDGTVRRVLTRSLPLARGEGVVSLVTMDDRTEVSPEPSALDVRQLDEANDLRRLNDELTQALAALRADVEAAEGERARAAQSMVEHDEFHAGVRAGLEQERDRLTQALGTLEQQHHSLLAERGQWQQSLLAATAAGEARAADQDHAGQQAMRAMEERLAQQAAALAQLEGERDANAGALQRLQGDWDVLLLERARWQELAQESERQGQALASLQQARDEAASALEAAVVKQQWLAAERQQLHDDLAAERIAHDAQAQAAASLQSERDSLRAERQQLAAERDALAAERHRLTEERDALSSGCQDMTAAREAASAERDTAAAERDRAVAALDAAAAERDRLAAERDRASDECRRLTARLDEAQTHAPSRLEAQQAQAFKELQRQYSAVEIERTAERAQWTLTATRAADDHRSAIRAIEAECERLTDELCKATGQIAERHTADAAHRDADRASHHSMGLELRAAQERIQRLVQEVTELQSALTQADARGRALRRNLAAAESRNGEISDRFERLIEADRADLQQLRRGLSQFLVDAERQCKALSDRRMSGRTPWEAWGSAAEQEQNAGAGYAGNGDVNAAESAPTFPEPHFPTDPSAY